MDTKQGVEILVNHLNKIDDKLESIKDHCAAIDVTLTKNTVDIAHHIARTDAVETLVGQNHTTLSGDVNDLKAKANKLQGALMLLTLLALVLEIWHYIKT